jgi:hypothetical protein
MDLPDLGQESIAARDHGTETGRTEPADETGRTTEPGHAYDTRLHILRSELLDREHCSERNRLHIPFWVCRTVSTQANEICIRMA